MTEYQHREHARLARESKDKRWAKVAAEVDADLRTVPLSAARTTATWLVSMTLLSEIGSERRGAGESEIPTKVVKAVVNEMDVASKPVGGRSTLRR